MAAIPAANIVNLTRQICGFKGSQLAFGPLPVEVFRINAGAIGDTAVLQPSNIKNITSVWGGVNHNIVNPTASTVTVTLAAAATAASPIDVYVIGAINFTN